MPRVRRMFSTPTPKPRLYERLVAPQPRIVPKGLPINKAIRVSMTKAMHAALVMEAWESGLPLMEYVRGLLERRGKWARSVGRAGGYDLQVDIVRREDVT